MAHLFSFYFMSTLDLYWGILGWLLGIYYSYQLILILCFSLMSVCGFEFLNHELCFSLSRWTTTFKQKVIQQCKALPTTSDLENLIHCAEAALNEEEISDNTINFYFNSIQFYFLIFFVQL